MAYTRISIWLFMVGIHSAISVDRFSGQDSNGLCDFNEGAEHNVIELVFCMEELANEALEDRFRGNDKSDVAASPRIGYDDYYSVPPYPQNNLHYQDYYGMGYKFPPSNFGGFNILRPNMNLFKALYAISRYDDYKCIPRVLCEIASGRYPGKNSNGEPYSFGNIGKNALFGILSALDITGSSPILSFGKAVVLGYMNRGRTETCYEEYSKCPRNSNDLINYLNTYNGGFFRFFGGYNPIQNPSIYRQAAIRTEPDSPPRYVDSNTERTMSGGWKFEDDSFSSRESYNDEYDIQSEHRINSTSVRFPDEKKLTIQSSINRAPKSLTDFNLDQGSNYENGPSSLFSQDNREDLEINYKGKGLVETRGEFRFPRSPNSRFKYESLMFPDGQKDAFPKVLADSYAQNIRWNSRRPRTENMQLLKLENFKMVNLPYLFPFDQHKLDQQAVHPCDVMCHDIYGSSVRFSQVLAESRKVDTSLTPNRPVFDVSKAIPCEVMCHDRMGNNRRLTMMLHQILRVDGKPNSSVIPHGFNSAA